jgi:cytochrome c556
MNLDPRDFSALRRKATELMSETADVPTVLRSRLGEQHELTRAADEMVASIETFVRELRSFDASAEPVIADTYSDL